MSEIATGNEPKVGNFVLKKEEKLRCCEEKFDHRKERDKWRVCLINYEKGNCSYSELEWIPPARAREETSPSVPTMWRNSEAKRKKKNEWNRHDEWMWKGCRNFMLCGGEISQWTCQFLRSEVTARLSPSHLSCQFSNFNRTFCMSQQHSILRSSGPETYIQLKKWNLLMSNYVRRLCSLDSLFN